MQDIYSQVIRKTGSVVVNFHRTANPGHAHNQQFFKESQD